MISTSHFLNETLLYYLSHFTKKAAQEVRKLDCQGKRRENCIDYTAILDITWEKSIEARKIGQRKRKIAFERI